MPDYGFEIGLKYSKADIYLICQVPKHQQRGNWDTGYTKYNRDWFIFCNIGTPGRTGHDYSNRFDNRDLIWYGKNDSHVGQPTIKSLLDPEGNIFIFYRESDRDPFTFAGKAFARSYKATVPVEIIWAFRDSSAPHSVDERSNPGSNQIPDNITRQHLLEAIADLDAGVAHQFGPSTGYDVLFENRRYPPKAVVGLAAGKILGAPLGPYDFKGGLKSKCFRILEQNGLIVVSKADTSPFPDEIDEKEAHIEGATQRVVVNRYERDRGARQKCIQHYGSKCQICGFDFEANYGADQRQLEFRSTTIRIPVHLVNRFWFAPGGCGCLLARPAFCNATPASPAGQRRE